MLIVSVIFCHGSDCQLAVEMSCWNGGDDNVAMDMTHTAMKAITLFSKNAIVEMVTASHQNTWQYTECSSTLHFISVLRAEENWGETQIGTWKTILGISWVNYRRALNSPAHQSEAQDCVSLLSYIHTMIILRRKKLKTGCWIVMQVTPALRPFLIVSPKNLEQLETWKKSQLGTT